MTQVPDERGRRACNLVMKGGLTSGVIYPPAIRRISERFHLVGIAGTSAGAIAACAAAAAEYRRRVGGGDEGYEALQEVSRELGRAGRILELLRPDHVTRREFALFTGGMHERGFFGRWARRVQLLWALFGYRARLGRIADNGFGLCSGMGLDAQGGVDVMPSRTITPWLSEIFDRIAGKDEPLTFGDLRHAPRPAGSLVRGDEHSIDLRIMATNMSFGRPMQLPFDGTRRYSFRPDEWRRLFPAKVMDYLERRGAELLDERGSKSLGEGWLPLPVGDDLPVVVAARMSLAFPFLFSAVPLWAVDYEDEQSLGEDGRALPDGGSLKRVWFSDGGITTNLPIHTFDEPLPRWPTLAINLQYTAEDGRPGRTFGKSAPDDARVYMIERRSQGAADLWYAFDTKRSAVARMTAFAKAVFRSAQVWYDNSFLKLPGYRDSVAEVWLSPDEGGMNLEMPPATIARLEARGEEVGATLRDRFADEESTASISWRGHRWVRFRSALAGLSDHLQDLARAAELMRDEGDEDWEGVATKLLDNTSAAGPQIAEAERAEAIAALAQLLRYAARLEPGHPFTKGPKPHIRLTSGVPLDR